MAVRKTYGKLGLDAMGDWLLGLVFTHPGVLRVGGRLLYAVGGLLALLGLRLDRVFRRVERVAHTRMTVDQVLPSWLAWAVPESTAGWAMVASLVVAGAALALTGKRIERLSR